MTRRELTAQFMNSIVKVNVFMTAYVLAVWLG
jgi:hypothetical protein